MNDKFVTDIVEKAIDAIERCFENGDVDTALVLIHLCKLVDPSFSVKLER